MSSFEGSILIFNHLIIMNRTHNRWIKLYTIIVVDLKFVQSSESIGGGDIIHKVSRRGLIKKNLITSEVSVLLRTVGG